MKLSVWDIADRIAGSGAVLVGLIALTALCVLLVRGGGGNAAVWAAWVQALGSVLALGVAIYLAENERRNRRAEREQDRQEREYAVAFDMAAITAELHMHVVDLHLSSAGDRGTAYYDVALDALKDLRTRLSNCSAGDVAGAHKTLALDIRKFMVTVMAYVARNAGAQALVAVPDWETWVEKASRLYDQAKMSLPVQSP